MMKNSVQTWGVLLCFLVISFSAIAQEQTIKLYDGKAPGSEEWNWKEGEMYSDVFGTEVVYNVTAPELLVFKPEEGKANGTAMIIAPGGGFKTLSINREGVLVAKELAAKGITAFVLKYRLLETKTNDPARELIEDLKNRDEFYKSSAAVQELAGNDIRTAITYIRQHATDFKVDTDKVGVIGFSAGATVIMHSVLKSEDATTLPNFAASLYGGPTDELMAQELPESKLPLFICAATDDQLGLAPKSIALYNKWFKAGYPVELHMYANGGHGFGMGTQALPVDTWYKRLEDWLKQFKYL